MKYIGFVFIMFLTFLSCKKKEIPQPTPEELIVGKWSIFSITRSDITTPACELDNRYEFKQGGVFVDNQGSNKCFLFFPSDNLGLWNMSDDYRKLTANQMTIQTDTIGGFPYRPNIQRNIILKKVQ